MYYNFCNSLYLKELWFLLYYVIVRMFTKNICYTKGIKSLEVSTKKSSPRNLNKSRNYDWIILYKYNVPT